MKYINILIIVGLITLISSFKKQNDKLICKEGYLFTKLVDPNWFYFVEDTSFLHHKKIKNVNFTRVHILFDQFDPYYQDSNTQSIWRMKKIIFTRNAYDEDAYYSRVKIFYKYKVKYQESYKIDSLKLNGKLFNFIGKDYVEADSIIYF